MPSAICESIGSLPHLLRRRAAIRQAALDGFTEHAGCPHLVLRCASGKRGAMVAPRGGFHAVTLDSKHPLPVRHVDPAAKLDAILAKVRDLPETEFFVQRDAGRVGQGDARDRAVHAKLLQVLEQLRIQRRTQALPAASGIEIHGAFDGMAVAAAGLPLVRVCVACDGPFAFGHQPRPGRGGRFDAARHFIDTHRYLFESGVAGGDVVVVDRADGGGVGE